MNYWHLLIPLLTAFSGWIVIRILRIMLFKPVKRITVLGIHFQGLVYRYQNAIALEVGRFAATEFSTIGELDQKLNDPRNFEAVRPLVEAHMDDFLRNKLKEQMPMVGMFIGDKTIQSLKTIFIQEIEELFPGVMQQFAGNLQKTLNIEQIIVSKLSSMPPGKLESLLSKSLDPLFRKAALLAVLTGILIGIIQFLLLTKFLS